MLAALNSKRKKTIPTIHPKTFPIGAENVAVADPATSLETVSSRAFVAEEFRESFVEVHFQEEDLRLVRGVLICAHVVVDDRP